MTDHNSQDWPLVYVASPYTVGDAGENVHRSFEVGRILLDNEISPVLPLLNHFMHCAMPRQAEDWMQMDLAILPRCDAVIRLHGYSIGADREVALAEERGIPVYYSVADLLESFGIDNPVV